MATVFAVFAGFADLYFSFSVNELAGLSCPLPSSLPLASLSLLPKQHLIVPMPRPAGEVVALFDADDLFPVGPPLGGAQPGRARPDRHPHVLAAPRGIPGKERGAA